MERVGLKGRGDVLPAVALEDFAAGDEVVDEEGALGDQLAGAEGVVSHLAVAHVVVRREPDRCPVSLSFRSGGERQSDVSPSILLCSMSL